MPWKPSSSNTPTWKIKLNLLVHVYMCNDDGHGDSDGDDSDGDDSDGDSDGGSDGLVMVMVVVW